MDFRIDEFDVFEKGDFMETILNVEINEQAYEMLDVIMNHYMNNHKLDNPDSTIEMWKLREQAKMQADTDDNADSDDDFYDDVIAQSALNWMEKD